MNVGDLVRRIKLDNHPKQDPRVGIIQDTFGPMAGTLCCVVVWNCGDTGHYFDTCLEVL